MALGRGLAAPLVLSKVRSWCSVPEWSFQGFLSRRFFALTVLTHIVRYKTILSHPTWGATGAGHARPAPGPAAPPILEGWRGCGQRSRGQGRGGGACSGRMLRARGCALLAGGTWGEGVLRAPARLLPRGPGGPGIR